MLQISSFNRTHVLDASNSMSLFCLDERIFSNYWMRLSRIWIILQIKEGVIHRGRRPSLITPSEFCRILHILRNIIHSKYFLFERSFAITLFVFPLTKYNITLSPGFLGQRLNNLQRAALLTSFWRHRFNNFRRAALLTSLIQYGEDSFQIWWTAVGYGELCVWF